MTWEFSKLVGSEKLIATTPAWANLSADVLEIVSPLQIEGLAVEGLQFRLTARKSMPDEMVTAQLEYHPGTEAGGPLARIEWRPLSGHNNRGRGPKPWQYRTIEGCHHHSFELNHKFAPDQVGRGSLPIAMPLDPAPESFDALMTLVSEAFRITNLEWVEVPPWEPALRLEMP